MKNLSPIRKISVSTNADKLALTNLSIGTEVTVTFNGNGRAVYRYLGGGESTDTNWELVSDIYIRKTSDTTISTTSFVDDPHLSIDYIPVGKYEVRMLINVYNTSGGGGSGGQVSQFTNTGTINALRRSAVFTGLQDYQYWPTIFSHAYWGEANYIQEYSCAIDCTVSGTLTVQNKMDSASSVGSFFLSGSYLLLKRII